VMKYPKSASNAHVQLGAGTSEGAPVAVASVICNSMPFPRPLTNMLDSAVERKLGVLFTLTNAFLVAVAAECGVSQGYFDCDFFGGGGSWLEKYGEGDRGDV
jgi:hypothetical protein